MKQCVLYDRECINCGECNRCDLDPNKICDNCCQCLELDKEAYRTLKISRVITDQEEIDAYNSQLSDADDEYENDELYDEESEEEWDESWDDDDDGEEDE